MKLHTEKTEDSIPVFDMKDGQIGIITKWSHSNKCVGNIVQRMDEILVRLGYGHFETYEIGGYDDSLRVEILPNGTLLEITNN